MGFAGNLRKGMMAGIKMGVGVSYVGIGEHSAALPSIL
jgi:hypothetical protein